MARSKGSGSPRHIRVFVSSPGDVVKERAIVREVVESLPKDGAFRGLVTTEAVAWDDPVAPVPMDAGATPQRSVDRGLPTPAECDLTVVILWRRLGTPLAEPKKADGTPYLSGTEYEFEAARSAGRSVWIYRCTAKQPSLFHDDDDDATIAEKRKQKQRVEDFFASLVGEDGALLSGHNPYDDVTAFRLLFEQHLKQFVRDLLAESAATTSTTRPSGARPLEKPAVPAAYRTWLQERCAGVELLGLRLKQGQHVRLKHVYVPLTTARAVEPEAAQGGKQRRPRPEEREELLRGERERDALLLDRVGKESAYISGDPGTGKSTFCRWLAWIACEGVVPAADVESPEEYRERLAPALAGRLPVLLPLRALWPRLFESGRPNALTPASVVEAAGAWLHDQGAPGLDAELVAAHVEQGTALLMFDGVDEVPPPQRVKLLEALAVARPQWTERGNRLVVTSRPYGLSESEVRQLGLPPLAIHPLPEPLQWHLVRRWFGILHDHASVAEASANQMLGQVRTQEWLAPLTQNPLLLTGMCIVFGDGKGLPEDKYELYDRVSDAVLHNRIPVRQQQQLVRERLAVVAHGMHTGMGLGESRATPQAEVKEHEIDTMLRAFQERSRWTEEQSQTTREARDELVTETGVLLQRGEDHAAFLHLSFQEFLAAQRMADVDRGRLVDVFVDRSQAPEWRNTLSFLFGHLLYTSTTPERAVNVLEALVEKLGPEPPAGLTLVAADAAEIFLRRKRRLAAEVEDRLRHACVAVMRGNAPARDRALVGTVLGRIGDHRFRADRWFLPDDDTLGFIEVPAGPFIMGSDKKKDAKAYDDELKQHQVTLPAYYVAKWPVTADQFKAFVNAEDNDGFTPGDLDCLKGVGNHPVAYVSWTEALAYCRWLTAKLKESDATPEALRRLLRGDQGKAWRVMLPSEAEWEKAARGADGRIYPWGDTPDPDRANYGDTGVNGTSAVGCFARGGTDSGVEELSGNVWEWTRSIGYDQSPYPYEPDYAGRSRENLRAGGGRVVRGGAFGDVSGGVRAAFRSRLEPDDRFRLLGFRVVVSPFSSDL